MQLTAEDRAPSLSPEEERARKRQAIGLTARRPTAKVRVEQPPEQGEGEGLLWLAVFFLLAMVLATVWLVVDALRSTQEAALPTARAETLLIQDEFDPPQLALAAETVADVWRSGVVDGAYELTIQQPGHLAWSTLGLLNVSTYRVESAMVLEHASTVSDQPVWGYGGLLARYQNPQNFYMFTVDGTGSYQVQLQKDEVWRTLQPWTPHEALAPAGDVNRLAVEDDGNALRFYANDALLYMVSDPRLPGGDVGLVGGTRSQGSVVARFDWLEIHRLPR